MKQLQWYEDFLRIMLLIISLQKSNTEYDVLSIQKQTLSQLTVMSYCIFTAALTINKEFWLFGRYNNT